MKSKYFDVKRRILSNWNKEQLENIRNITHDSELRRIAHNYLVRIKLEEKYYIKIDN